MSHRRAIFYGWFVTAVTAIVVAVMEPTHPDATRAAGGRPSSA
jgi:hypothetical protein